MSASSTAAEEQPAASDVDAQDSRPVTDQTVSSVWWMTLQKWVTRILGFVTIAVLTRLLNPEDFGAVAAAMTVLPFFYVLSDFGFAAYIMQAERVDQRLLSTGFWFASVCGLVLGGALFLAAPVLGQVYADDRTVSVLQALALVVPITASSSVSMALLRRAMRFRTLAVQGAAAAIAAQVVAIGLAVTGFGVWALVGQTVTGAVVGSVLAWVSAQWRPSLQFSRSLLVTMIAFGGQVLAVEFVALGRAWGEAAIISSTLGIAALGYLSIAQRLVAIVQELTGSAVVPVSLVAFSRVRGSHERLAGAYLRAIRMTYATLGPPLVVVAVTAPFLVPVVFGPGWEQSARLAQVLAIAGTITIGAALDHGLFYGAGRPGTWLVYAVLIDGATIATTALVVTRGLDAVVWGFLGVVVVATVLRWFLVARLLEVPTRVVARPFVLLVWVFVVNGTVGWLAAQLVEPLPALLAVAAVGSAMLLAHLVLLHLVAPDVEQEIARLLRKVPVLGPVIVRHRPVSGPIEESTR